MDTAVGHYSEEEEEEEQEEGQEENEEGEEGRRSGNGERAGKVQGIYRFGQVLQVFQLPTLGPQLASVHLLVRHKLLQQALQLQQATTAPVSTLLVNSLIRDRMILSTVTVKSTKLPHVTLTHGQTMFSIMRVKLLFSPLLPNAQLEGDLDRLPSSHAMI